MSENNTEINIGIPKFNSLAGALAEIYGSDIRLNQSFRIPGGDINKAYGMQLSNGKILFMKTNEKQNSDRHCLYCTCGSGNIPCITACK